MSKGAVNIDGVGSRIIDLLIDHHLIEEVADLYTLKVGDLIDLPSFKEKAAQNVIDAIAAAREIPLARLLIGLSIEHIGEETAELLAEYFGTLKAIQSAKEIEIASIHGIGDIVATSLYSWMREEKNIRTLGHLLKHITVVESASKKETKLSGKTLVFTGTLPNLGRDEAKAIARNAGANVSSSVSAKTDYVVAGGAAGSKAKKAAELGVALLSEQEFLKMAS